MLSLLVVSGLERPVDRGPIYAETDMSRFPVEPWNTGSLLIFLFVALYFLVRIRGRFTEHKIITVSTLLMLVGFVGGSVYHACRCDNLWLFMDFIPIALIGVIGGGAFWYYLFRESSTAFVRGLILVAIVILVGLLVKPYISRQFSISLGYVRMALMIVLPAFLLSGRRNWRGIQLLTIGLLSFVFAISFRILDFHPRVTEFLPMGTHFLWHLFGGLSALSVLKFQLDFDILRATKTGNLP